jgi:hypothetical protein
MYLLPAIAVLNGCNLINPAEQIPAYLEIDTLTLITNPGEGSASHKITDVWVDADDVQLGVYEVPKTFPVIDSGKTFVVVSAGIMDNGISATRVIYPFYYPDTFSIDLTEKKIYSLFPHFVYRSTAKFSFIEDFEAGNAFQQISGDTNMIRTSNPDEVFEGSYSSYIYLDKELDVYEGRTANSYSFDQGVPVYLELNYKCDQPFIVGLYGIKPSTGNVYDYRWQVNAKDTWNKIYLNMGNDVKEIGADSYQVLIEAIFDSTNTSSHIYLDNIKLVSF